MRLARIHFVSLRRSLLLLLLVGSACATPPIRVTPTFPPGQQRTYSIDARATTITRTPAGARTERTHLKGRSILDLISAVDDGTRARIEMTPKSLTRDGQRVETPRPQVADVVIGAGGLIDVLEVDGVPGSLLPVGAADLASLLGPPLPTRALQPGERFTLKGASGRVTALRVERGYLCAIIRIGSRREVTRNRQDDTREIALSGTEISDLEIAFAIREGFPVRIDTTAEAPLRVTTNGGASGEILVRTVTTLTLIEPRAR